LQDFGEPFPGEAPSLPHTEPMFRSTQSPFSSLPIRLRRFSEQLAQISRFIIIE
jgi:hypothetical protein